MFRVLRNVCVAVVLVFLCTIPVFYGLIVAGFLHFTGTSQHVYGVISGMLWIYHPDKTPLPLAVVWEQLFSGDLYWVLLLCLAIVFCPTLSAFRGRRKSPSQ